MFQRTPLHRSLPAALLAALGLSVFSSCASKTGRLKNDDEGVLVDNSRLGLAATDEIVRSTTQLALEALRAELDPSQYLVFVMMPLKNSTREEVRDLREMIEGNVRTELFQAELVDVISNDLVGAGMNAVGVPASNWSDLYLEGTRQRFLETVGTNATRPTHFLKMELTGGTSSSGRTEDRRYTLAIEINDAEDGRAIVREQASQLKEYTR